METDKKGAVDVIEDAALDVAGQVITADHVAAVETLVQGLAEKALLDAVSTSIPFPFVGALLAHLITDERVHLLLKAVEAKVVELARAAAGKTATTFDDKIVELVAAAEGV